MPTDRTILIAGAGIGGLTAALALSRAGFPVVVFEAARHLSEIGAGIQLSPNAVHVLRELGIAERLAPDIVAPTAVRVRSARSGRDIARIPLGTTAEARYGAPYWIVHRAHLQRALLAAIEGCPDAILRLGVSVLDVARHEHGVTIAGKTANGVLIEEQGTALIAADGVWSNIRPRLNAGDEAVFSRRTAWRALIAAEDAEPHWFEAETSLWLGPGAHLVHYPVCGGSALNVVAIVNDDAPRKGWAGAGERDALVARFARWHRDARRVIERPAGWQTWSLFDLPAKPRPGRGAVTLLGDAAHATLPFVAQGGAMAIEDAIVLAHCIERGVARGHDIASAMREYETLRAPRTMRVQAEAAANGARYAWRGPLALARDFAISRMGGEALLRRYDWLYGWRPAE